MREVKFRGKIAVTDGWVYGHYVFADGYHVIYENGNPYIIKLNTLGQYTGLKDKNGKEIYEGDIVHVKYSHDYMTFEGYERVYSQLKNGYVKFNHGTFDVYYTDKEGREVCAGIVIQEHLTDIETEWEVIGNIYENPELLETK